MADLILRWDDRALVVMDPEREWVFAADPRGRMVLVHTPRRSWRRSRENRWFRLIREDGTWLAPVPAAEIQEQLPAWQAVWARARDQVRGRRDRAGAALRSVLEAWCSDFWSFHERDAQAFRSLYGTIPILPPDAYTTVYVRISEGCPWNRCGFCSFYRDRRFRVLSLDWLRTHLAGVRRYWAGTLGSRNGLFLGDANALAMSERALFARLEQIRDTFPELCQQGIHSFFDAITGSRWSEAGFRELRRQGLVRLSIGVESGDGELMEILQKPLRQADLEGIVRAIKGAGMALNLIFILGLGGRRKREDHFQASMALLERLPLSFPDRVYLSPLWIPPDSVYRRLARQYDWEELDGDELRAEWLRWRRVIRALHPRVQVSPYNIRFFAY